MHAVIGPLMICVVALGLFIYLPVPVTVYSSPADENMVPRGEILPQNPLTHCTDDISRFTPYRRVNIAVMLATYNRVNTSRYRLQVYVAENGSRTVLGDEFISASEVKDNAFRRFELEVPPTTPGRLCVSLSTNDAAEGNALTVWLNGRGNPVMEITAFGTPEKLFDDLAAENDFGLGRETLLGLFLGYLLVQSWLVFYLYAKAKPSDNPYRRRTG
jgi:hypothetical protein